MTKTPNLSVEFSRLPLPNIRDEIIQYTHKQSCRREEDSNRFRPPKYKSRYDSNFNRSVHNVTANNSHIAQVISFRNESKDKDLLEADTLPLPTTISYDSSASESFFEQSFTRLSKIGEGSFGEVFKVRSNEDGRLYAVKMSKQLFRGESYRAERLEEVRRYEQFSGHDNCIRFYRAWEQDDRLYMQMELCRESLETYLWRRKYLPEDRIWSIFLDLLLALKSLHDRNLLHLDIKLDNVLIDDDETCKLADFGLVVDVNKANRHQATEGDSRYIAPEILQGQFSKAADIFSLGIAMLELSCYLELPSNGPLWQQLRHGMLPEEFLKNISPELQKIIKDMMNPDPLCRPTVNQLLALKNFKTVQQRRNQWSPLKKLRRTIRHSRRFVFSKLCNIRCAALRWLSYLLDTLHLHKAIKPKPVLVTTDYKERLKPVTPKVRVQIIGSTPIPNKSSTGNSSNFHTSPEPNFDVSPLTKVKLNFDDSIETSGSDDDSASALQQSIRKNISFEDLELSSNSIIRRPHDASTLRRKLFTQTNEK